MSRVPVVHLTRPARLPLIEEEGLRTRADLSRRYGPPGEEDRAAPGRYANGRRVSAYLSLDHARTEVADLGPGVVAFTVDPAKVIAVPGAARTGDPGDYWAAARGLDEWLDDGAPDDLEVHQAVPVRAKHLELRAALFESDDLGRYASIVAGTADSDRLSAKALMHLLIVASEGDFDSPEFNAAVALAWRDEPDPDSLVRELVEVGPDTVASAALAEYGAAARDAAGDLRTVLDDTREWADAQGVDQGQGLLLRSATVLDELDPAPR